MLRKGLLAVHSLHVMSKHLVSEELELTIHLHIMWFNARSWTSSCLVAKVGWRHAELHLWSRVCRILLWHLLVRIKIEVCEKRIEMLILIVG